MNANIFTKSIKFIHSLVDYITVNARAKFCDDRTLNSRITKYISNEHHND